MENGKTWDDYKTEHPLTKDNPDDRYSSVYMNSLSIMSGSEGGGANFFDPQKLSVLGTEGLAVMQSDMDSIFEQLGRDIDSYEGKFLNDGADVAALRGFAGAYTGQYSDFQGTLTMGGMHRLFVDADGDGNVDKDINNDGVVDVPADFDRDGVSTPREKAILKQLSPEVVAGVIRSEIADMENVVNTAYDAALGAVQEMDGVAKNIAAAEASEPGGGAAALATAATAGQLDGFDSEQKLFIRGAVEELLGDSGVPSDLAMQMDGCLGVEAAAPVPVAPAPLPVVDF